MIRKRLFVLNGHPGATSLCRALAECYAAAAEAAGHEVRLTHLSDLDFDMDYGLGGYDNRKPLEPCLDEVLQTLEWCERITVVSPLWWGGLPAKLKGLLDRVLVPGRTFDTRNLNWYGMPKPLLTGRTGRVIMTSDTPRWFLRMAYGSAIIRQLKGQIFHFVGFKPLRVTWFAGASDPTEKQVKSWLRAVEELGTSGA